MSGTHSRSQSPWISALPESHNNGSSASSMFRISSLRYPRDGLDMRTPVMSQPLQRSQSALPVIDLTQEPDSPQQPQTQRNPSQPFASIRASRPPRFSRDIIDIDGGDGDVDSNAADAGDDSPDVELLYSRELPSQPLSARSRAGGFSDFIRAAFHNRQGFGESANVEDVLRGRNSEGMGQFQRVVHVALGRRDVENDMAFTVPRPDFMLPGELNFVAQGFPMGDQPPPASAYEPPPPPSDGFTRTLDAEDLLICPNCSTELGADEDEVKRQVWVVKKCGHVRACLSLSLRNTNIR